MSYADLFHTYITNPKRAGNLLSYEDESVIVIKDLYPKALRHYLVIPRSLAFTNLHPLKALSDIRFYDKLRDYVDMTKQMIVDDLVDCGLVPGDMAFAANFKTSFIQCGVHSIPSMNNVHIHVMTKDFHSPKMKHKKHYSSFNSSFFVKFECLGKQDREGHGVGVDGIGGIDNDTEYSDSDDTIYSNSDEEFVVDTAKLHDIIKSTPLCCSYCNKSFGNKFVELKKHLDEEFKRKFDTSKDCRPNRLNF